MCDMQRLKHSLCIGAEGGGGGGGSIAVRTEKNGGNLPDIDGNCPTLLWVY